MKYKRYNTLLKRLNNDLINEYNKYNKSASIIQGCVRGYWSRISLKLFLKAKKNGYFKLK